MDDRGTDERAQDDLGALEHERWQCLWNGALRLLRAEAPRAFDRLMTSLERHGLARTRMSFSHEPDLTYTERLTMATFAVTRFDGVPPDIVQDVVKRAQAFLTDPRVASLQGKSKARLASDRELLLAYQAALWHIDTRSNRRKLRGQEARAEQARMLVAQHYGHKNAESVATFLQDARRRVPAAEQKIIKLMGGQAAWEMTIGAERDGRKK